MELFSCCTEVDMSSTTEIPFRKAPSEGGKGRVKAGKGVEGREGGLGGQRKGESDMS